MWRRPDRDAGCLAEIAPPRVLEDGIAAARGMFAGLGGATLALEIAVTAGGPRWYVRAGDERALAIATASVRATQPHAESERVPPDRPDLDPARLLGPERCRVLALRQRPGPDLPLRADWRGERDPLAAVLAAAAAVDEGERVVIRLAVRPAGEGAAGKIRARAERPPLRREDPRVGPTSSALPLLSLLGLIAASAQAWRWYQAGDRFALAAACAAALVGLPLAGALLARARRGHEPFPGPVVERKLAAPLLAASLEIAAFGPATTPAARLEALAGSVAQALRAYDDAAGGSLRPGRWRKTFGSALRSQRLPLLLSTAEAAALWHLPDEATPISGARRTRARRLAPPPGYAATGARVGTAGDGANRTPVYLSAGLLGRNHLMVAKTRRGKSTLLRHLAAGVMERAAAGAEPVALAVIDPHQDLAEAVLGSVPDAIADRVIYLDFADMSRPIGLNLLDVALFPDRDRTTEHVITILNRLWPANWGPRMEGALRASLSSLLEANTRLPREEQFTLLDIAPFLTDARLRERVLTRVQDPALQAWFRDNYNRAGRVLQQQTANPVTSKIGRFTVTEASRLVLGQARSTFDPREVLQQGAVLVVNTAVGALGEGAASLIGATLINLLGLLVEEQVAVPAAQRRRLVALIDESTTLGAVDYPRMLSELGKYGASFVLVTQSLAKLDAIDPNLAPTIFSNADGLTVFQISAEDARRLTPELGSGIEVEDLVSLDDYECYARWWEDGTRPAAFTFRVDPPPPTNPARARAIAARSQERFGRPRDEVVAEITKVLAERSPEPPPEERNRRRRGPQAAAQTPATHSTAPAGHEDVPVDPPTPAGASEGVRA